MLSVYTRVCDHIYLSCIYIRCMLVLVFAEVCPLAPPINMSVCDGVSGNRLKPGFV